MSKVPPHPSGLQVHCIPTTGEKAHAGHAMSSRFSPGSPGVNPEIQRPCVTLVCLVAVGIDDGPDIPAQREQQGTSTPEGERAGEISGHRAELNDAGGEPALDDLPQPRDERTEECVLAGTLTALECPNVA